MNIVKILVLGMWIVVTTHTLCAGGDRRDGEYVGESDHYYHTRWNSRKALAEGRAVYDVFMKEIDAIIASKPLYLNHLIEPVFRSAAAHGGVCQYVYHCSSRPSFTGIYCTCKDGTPCVPYAKELCKHFMLQESVNNDSVLNRLTTDYKDRYARRVAQCIVDRARIKNSPVVYLGAGTGGLFMDFTILRAALALQNDLKVTCIIDTKAYEKSSVETDEGTRVSPIVNNMLEQIRRRQLQHVLNAEFPKARIEVDIAIPRAFEPSFVVDVVSGVCDNHPGCYSEKKYTAWDDVKKLHTKAVVCMLLDKSDIDEPQYIETRDGKKTVHLLHTK